MWLTRYQRPTKITYDQGPEFFGHEFSESPIKKEYVIIAKASNSGNPT